MPVGHKDYYGYKPGCCRFCSGCFDPWKCDVMKCQICSWYVHDEYSQNGYCGYQYKPQTHIEKLKAMLIFATIHFNELPPKSVDYYCNLSLKNPSWIESEGFWEKYRGCRLIKKVLTK